MRIAFFMGSFPVVSETFILRQITGLIDAGHTVHLFADTRADDDIPRHEEIDRYRLLEQTTFMDLPPACAPWEIPAWPWTGKTWLPGATAPIPNWRRLTGALPRLARCALRAPSAAFRSIQPAHFGYRARSLSALYRLDTLLRHAQRYDILHAHFGPVGESFRFARDVLRAPFLVSFHGYDFCTVPRKEGRDVYRRLFAAADAVTVNSNYTRQQLEALSCPAAKLHRLPVGLNPESFHFQERKPGRPARLITIARLVEIKGHEFCLRALARVRSRLPEFQVHYDLVGDGPLRPKLEALARELGVADAVAFHGSRPGADVQPLLQQAHLFVLASVTVEGDREGQGLVLQEAQACGLPIVATRHGAFPEGVREGESALLVPERDPEALAGAIVQLLQKPEQWAEMGRAGRRFVEERFDIRP